MGGVDLINSVMALYRTIVRSKNIIIEIFSLDGPYVCQCLLYRQDATEEDNMPFLDFKIDVQDLLKANKSSGSQVNKIARPKSLSLETEYKSKCKRRPAAPIPTSNVRLDEVGHFAEFSEKKGRT